MSDNTNEILAPWEAEAWIENLKFPNFDEIITKKWFQHHKQLMLLHQQSILEITSLKEESVKEWFVTFHKIPILIYEAVQISIWKQKVFPLIIEMHGEPKNTFMVYSVFYHESMAVALLENVLFHSESVETLQDSALDLIDYTVGNITNLIFSQTQELNELPHEASCLEELNLKKRQLEFDIAIKSISILAYIAGFAEMLPLCVLKRILSTHDVPYLFSQLIEKKPWIRVDANGALMIYLSQWGKVKETDSDKVSKVEGLIWIALRELLLNQKCGPYYPINEFRISQLSKLQKYLNERVIDQVAPLMDLRRWLSYLNISASGATTAPAITVEILPQIRSTIMEKYKKKFKKIARMQGELLYNDNIEHIKEYAGILSGAYDVDKMVAVMAKHCTLCSEIATKKCSKCKSAWYCGRECQVKDWTVHKAKCKDSAGID